MEDLNKTFKIHIIKLSVEGWKEWKAEIDKSIYIGSYKIVQKINFIFCILPFAFHL